MCGGVAFAARIAGEVNPALRLAFTHNVLLNKHAFSSCCIGGSAADSFKQTSFAATTC
jgi:hypothetical protein